MGKFMMGAILLPIGFVLTLIPPFIFGIPVFAAAMGLCIAGLVGGTAKAAKATATGIQAVQAHNAQQAYAARLAELEARERALAAHEAQAASPR